MSTSNPDKAFYLLCFVSIFLMSCSLILPIPETTPDCPNIPSYLLQEVSRENKLKDLTVGSIIDQSIERKELLEQCRTQLNFIKIWDAEKNVIYNKK
jgi:hypothetical protein